MHESGFSMFCGCSLGLHVNLILLSPVVGDVLYHIFFYNESIYNIYNRCTVIGIIIKSGTRLLYNQLRLSQFKSALTTLLPHSKTWFKGQFAKNNTSHLMLKKKNMGYYKTIGLK